jgi:RNA polymerase sigma-70 factor (ECF subfamily)
MIDHPELVAVYEQNRSLFVNFASSTLGRATDAEDIVQQAYVAVARRMGAIEDVRRYFYTAIRNMCLDALRRQKKIRQVSLADLDETSSPDQSLKAPTQLTTDITPVEIANRGDHQNIVRRAIQQLEANPRSVVELAYFQDLPHSEIAKIIGISEGNSRKILSRALQELRVHLAPFIKA